MDTIFDIVRRDDDFILYADGKPFLTPSGNQVTHANARLLRLGINHSMFRNAGKIHPLQLLEQLSDASAGGQTISESYPGIAITNDPLLPGEHTRSFNLSGDLIRENPDVADFIFLNASSLASSLANFFRHKGNEQSEKEYLSQIITDFSPEKQSVLAALYTEFGAGLTIHCMLINEILSLTEYAAGLLILRLRNDLPESISNRAAEGMPGLVRLQEQIISDAMPAVDFLTLCKSENKISVIEEIIRRGEDNRTEFKSTLRWDIRQGLKSPAIEHACLKTIGAFLNSEGGDLMIGVQDDGSFIGIETDQFDNNDRFLLHFWTLVKTSLGQEVVEWVNTSLQQFGNKTICRVNCRKARTPVFLRQKGFEEAFFIRVGPSSNSLEISSALKYIEQHF